MKILLIQKNDGNVIGGVEKYNKNLQSFFVEQKHEVQIICLANIDQKKFNVEKKIICKCHKYNNLFENSKSIITKSLALLHFTLYARKAIDSLAISEFDIIIDSTYIYFKKLIKNKKYIWVQHSAPKFYKGYVSNNFIINWLFYLFSKTILRRGNFQKIENVVVFDKFNKKYFNKSANVFTIPIGLYSHSEIVDIKNKTIINNKKNTSYIGRIDNYSKNVKTLINKKIQVKINAYGQGPHEFLLSKNKNISYLGPYAGKNDLMKILTHTKFSLLPSNYEGFPLTVVESLSHGTPSLIKNSFPSAEFLAINSNFLAKNNSDFIQRMNNLNVLSDEDYINLVDLCFKFALEHLTLEKFYSNWDNVIKIISKTYS